MIDQNDCDLLEKTFIEIYQFLYTWPRLLCYDAVLPLPESEC